jgi:aminomethyltransferase
VAGWDCATEADPDPEFERSPLDLGLGWLVNLDAMNFVGRDALAEQKQRGSRFVLRSFAKTDASKPEDGCEIWGSVEDQDIRIGSVNCSSWSWGLEKMIGNASILRQYMGVSDAWIVIDSERQEVKLSRGPLLKLERRNQVPAPIEE